MLIGHFVGAELMLLAALVTAILGHDAARKPLEEVAKPLSWR